MELIQEGRKQEALMTVCTPSCSAFSGMKLAAHLATAGGVLVSALFIVYGFRTGIFTSQAALTAFLGRFGIWTPAVFVLFQAVQVVFPILPGGIGCVVGVLFFGNLWGFLYNYIGICIGSAAAFLLARHYGRPLMAALFSTKLLERYSAWTEKANFTRWFALAIFAPVAPDDFLCYLAGTTRMRFRTFLVILILGKPATLALYTLGLSTVLRHVLGWVQMYFV